MQVVDDCVDDDCMYIPMMVWVIFNVSFVFIATFLVAIIEVSVSIHTYTHIHICMYGEGELNVELRTLNVA